VPSLGRAVRAAGSRPNILFCIGDDISFPHASAYGCPWVRTPGFDRVAKEGLLFTRAYTPNAKCAPSRSCILTGRNSWQLEAAANHIPYYPAKFKSFPEVLSESGYFVGFTAKGWGPGNPGEINGQQRRLTGTPFQQRKAPAPTAQIASHDYAANFRDFLEARSSGQPFCFWFGSQEPHRAYEYGSGIRLGGKKLADVDRVFSFWPDNETVRTDILDYAFEIEHFDRHVARMLQMLEERGELDNTLVVVTADNGMPFPRVKGQVYELSNHMPLAIMWRRGIAGAGRKVEDFVSFIDIAPTLLELAEAEPSRKGMQPILGRSLAGIFRASKSGRVEANRDHVLIGKERHDVGRPHDWGYPIRGILKDEYLYLRNFEPDRWPAGNPETGYLNCDGSPTKTECLRAKRNPATRRYWELSFGKRPEEEFYNVKHDPDCIRNLAAEPEQREAKGRLEKQLTAELRQQGDPRMFGRGPVFDEYPYADERQRNFYERYMRGEKIAAGWVNPSDFEKREND
jgi:arylsulfatase A-like enzyme